MGKTQLSVSPAAPPLSSMPVWRVSLKAVKNRGADVVYGMCNGVAGLLEEVGGGSFHPADR